MSGREWRIDPYRRVLSAVVWPSSFSFKIVRAATMPAEKTNDPTPTSIKDVPQVSTFANRRGKTLKSTARIPRHVAIIIDPRYIVKNGFLGSWFATSCFARFDGGSFGCFLGGGA